MTTTTATHAVTLPSGVRLEAVSIETGTPMAAFAQPLDALATEVARGRRAARRAATSSRAAQVGTDRDASGAAGA